MSLGDYFSRSPRLRYLCGLFLINYFLTLIPGFNSWIVISVLGVFTKLRIWTIVTSGFVEMSPVGVLINSLFVLYMGKRFVLEEKIMLKMMLFTNSVAYLIVISVISIYLLISKNQEYFGLLIGGFTPAIIGIIASLKDQRFLWFLIGIGFIFDLLLGNFILTLKNLSGYAGFLIFKKYFLSEANRKALDEGNVSIFPRQGWSFMGNTNDNGDEEVAQANENSSHNQSSMPGQGRKVGRGTIKEERNQAIQMLEGEIWKAND